VTTIIYIEIVDLMDVEKKSCVKVTNMQTNMLLGGGSQRYFGGGERILNRRTKFAKN
jgi:hypothetical protein